MSLLDPTQHPHPPVQPYSTPTQYTYEHLLYIHTRARQPPDRSNLYHAVPTASQVQREGPLPSENTSCLVGALCGSCCPSDTPRSTDTITLAHLPTCDPHQSQRLMGGGVHPVQRWKHITALRKTPCVPVYITRSPSCNPLQSKCLLRVSSRTTQETKTESTALQMAS